jgi:DNA (cytosine-5)-methyltransferase 1
MLRAYYTLCVLGWGLTVQQLLKDNVATWKDWMINELALFAGAGGGLLASAVLRWRTVCAVEYSPWNAGVLAQRQNDGVLEPFPIWDDVRTFDGRQWRGVVDVVSGGFPCQAFSSAARGRNIAEKDLWPEMRRIVCDVEPQFVFGENVSAKAIDRACDDLEALGYQTRAVTLSAADLGADHLRERHWLLAYTDDQSELLRGVDAEVALLAGVHTGVWETDPGHPGVDDGLANRMERYTATGNGQVPVVAVTALLALAGL